MKIIDAYAKYRIPEGLQLHQLRVASVGKIIAENSLHEINSDTIIKALLIHDMGNIIKFNLDVFTDLLGNEGIVYWRKVKEDFVNKYGKDDHKATSLIAKELGVKNSVINIIDRMGFGKSIENFESGDLNMIICAYSDMRVLPTGVTSLIERLEDISKRYGQKYNDGLLEKRKKTYFEMEKLIFKNNNIQPEDINESSVNECFEMLKNIEI